MSCFSYFSRGPANTNLVVLCGCKGTALFMSPPMTDCGEIEWWSLHWAMSEWVENSVNRQLTLQNPTLQSPKTTPLEILTLSKREWLFIFLICNCILVIGYWKYENRARWRTVTAADIISYISPKEPTSQLHLGRVGPSLFSHVSTHYRAQVFSSVCAFNMRSCWSIEGKDRGTFPVFHWTQIFIHHYLSLNYPPFITIHLSKLEKNDRPITAIKTTTSHKIQIMLGISNHELKAKA